MRIIEIIDYHGDMSLRLPTKTGNLQVDIERSENVGKDSGYISFFPAGAEGDGFDIARAVVLENGDIKVSIFTDVYSKDPTFETIIAKRDIDKAFYLENDEGGKGDG